MDDVIGMIKNPIVIGALITFLTALINRWPYRPPSQAPSQEKQKRRTPRRRSSSRRRSSKARANAN
jgi:hypothetical protein